MSKEIFGNGDLSHLERDIAGRLSRYPIRSCKTRFVGRRMAWRGQAGRRANFFGLNRDAIECGLTARLIMFG